MKSLKKLTEIIKVVIKHQWWMCCKIKLVQERDKGDCKWEQITLT